MRADTPYPGGATGARALPLARTPLRDCLQSRRWLWRTHPFPHIVAYDVFVPAVHEALARRVREAVGAFGGHSYLDGHDIFGATITAATADEVWPFTSREWHDMLARLLRVQPTGHVALGIHHHRIGSADGFPHNDVNMGWFAADPPPGAIELTRPEAVEYTTGVAKSPGVMPRETVRAVAALYYVANGDWQPGDGGTTGLYARSSDPVREPAMIVPPIDNSLLVFECTPTSWHGFIGNNRRERSTIIMWLHRPKDEVIRRWGARAIVPYGQRPRQADR